MEIKIKKQTLKIAAVVVLFFLLAFFIFQQFSPASTSLQNGSGSINLWTIFLTGLFTGGLTCLAVQGGLLAATIAQREEKKLLEKSKEQDNALPIISFLLAKLFAYTVLGFLLGWFGSLFQLSLTAQIIMQVVVIVFMIGTACNILEVHPIFRYFVIQPPKSLTRIVRKQSKSSSLFTPVLLGAFTIFIPCGTTQAMMALAIGSGSPILGALVLFAFILGTSPLFFTLGYFATRLSDSLHKKFMRFAAITLILLALFNLNNVLALSGHPINLAGFVSSSTDSSNTEGNVVSSATIQIENSGYTPQTISVKAGSTVKLNLQNNGAYTCASAFTIPYFNYQKVIPVGKREELSLKMPDKPTTISFMCSMGMYRGVIDVL